jgi:molybdopterin molybdotransferase
VRVADGAVTAGDGVRGVGVDVHAGDRVLPARTVLTPLAVAAAASLGVAAVPCVRAPRVVVLVTGDELVPPGAPLRRGQVHESNGLLVAGTVAALGAEVVRVEPVPDDAEATQATFARALADGDVVVSSGGVSVGPHDHVKPALRALGVVELFWRVAVQPGKPVWAGARDDGRLVLGLPGNPLSTLVGLHLLVRPLLAVLSGLEPDTPVPGTLGAPVARRPARDRILPVCFRDGAVTQLGAGASHQLARAATADALVVVPRGTGELPAGATVDVVPL